MEIEELKIKKIREPDFTPFEKDFVNALYINQFTAKQIKEQLKTEGFDRCEKAIQKLMLKLDANNAISNRKLCGRKKGLGKETKEKLKSFGLENPKKNAREITFDDNANQNGLCKLKWALQIKYQ